jgi:hypothetical protein
MSTKDVVEGALDFYVSEGFGRLCQQAPAYQRGIDHPPFILIAVSLYAVCFAAV